MKKTLKKVVRSGSRDAGGRGINSVKTQPSEQNEITRQEKSGH